jgi:release factor glutamine methyltransferase
VTAIDASQAALAVASENARRLLVQPNVETRLGNWYGSLRGETFSLIAANPPYVAAADPHLLLGDLRFEPRAALAAGADGLDDLRVIVAGAPTHLNSGGWLLCEHGYDQAHNVRELFIAAGFGAVFCAPDLAGILRVTGGQWQVI